MTVTLYNERHKKIQEQFFGTFQHLNRNSALFLEPCSSYYDFDLHFQILRF